jgi:hypothetical protein
MMKYLIAYITVITAVLLLAVTVKADTLPNQDLTPGIARDVDKQTLCTTSTKLARNVPESVKKQSYANYGMTGNHTGYCDGKSGCEVDHLISLELGGANDIKNLWPQPYDNSCNAHQKDALENKLHRLICKGTITMQDAQTAISVDWIAAYTKYIDPKGCQ